MATNERSVPADETTDAGRAARALARLKAWFGNPYVKRTASFLVPGALAAILFPFLGPAAAAAPAIVAVQNGLKAFGVDLSGETIRKIWEKKAVDEDTLSNALDALLKQDPEVNKDAAKAMIDAAPKVQEAIKANPEASRDELADLVKRDMAGRGGALAQVAEQYGDLLKLDGPAFETLLDNIKQRLSTIEQEQLAEDGGVISEAHQVAADTGGIVKQKQHARGGRIEKSDQWVIEKETKPQ